MADADPAPLFRYTPHPAPVPAAERQARLIDPGFGRVFTDHMTSVRWSEARGWHEAELMPRGPLELDPATAVLHYAQEIFEGLKAYRTVDNGIALFRAQANARRFQVSAERLAMPLMPEALFVAAVRTLVRADQAWVPDGDGALYLRPFMFADEVFLGVRPAKSYRFLVIAASVGPYFSGGKAEITIGVARDHVRAAPGGTGAAKCGGNYAASLAPQARAIAEGCDQLVFLDAIERRWVEELGGMNLCFVFDDGRLVTPPLDGTILPGITRDSLLQLARDAGLEVREERYGIDQWRADAESGHLTETFACGTAAVVTPVARVLDGDASFTIGGGTGGPVAAQLRAQLVAIQRGATNDPHQWVERVV